MFELERCQDRQAAYASSTVARGQFYPLNEMDLSHVRLLLKDSIGEDISSYPVLVGPNDLPFKELPTPDQLQNVLMDDIGGHNFFRFAPSHGSPELDAKAIFELLINLLDNTYEVRGAVVHMESPTLQRLWRDTPATHVTGTLGVSKVNLTVAPCGEVFDLEYFGYTRIIPLLLGAQVVIAFPPTPDNLNVLRTSYQNVDSIDSIYMHTSTLFSHGIALMQKAGETLILPPFWSHAIFCTHTCVSAGYSVASAYNVPDRLRHIELLRAVMHIWPDRSKEQEELTKYATELAAHMDRILSLKVEGFTNPHKFAFPLWKGWDGDFRHKFGGLVAAIEDEEERGRIMEVANKALVKFVESARKKRPECRMCHKRVEDMNAMNGTPEQRLARHVRAAHGV